MPRIFTPNPEHSLILRQEAEGVAICIVDGTGKLVEGFRVAHIMEDGKLYLCSGIDRNIAESVGIKLDAQGRIAIGN